MRPRQFSAAGWAWPRCLSSATADTHILSSNHTFEDKRAGSERAVCHIGWRNIRPLPAMLLVLVGVGLLTGCASRPMGADRVEMRQAYEQIEANALSANRPSAETMQLLHRYDLGTLVEENPVEALRKLHERAQATGERQLLFALAESSYALGEKFRRSLKAWEPNDPRDYYLGAAVYAYLYLFGPGQDPQPDAYDRRFRTACDLYNYGLGWALTERRATNGTVQLGSGRRRLPVGEIELAFKPEKFPWSLDLFEQFLLADLYRVRGISVRNREGGLGTPLIGVGRLDENLRLHRTLSATALLRMQGGIGDLTNGHFAGVLELHSSFGDSTVDINGAAVPLEMDLTTAKAYALNQSFAWEAQKLQFFSAAEGLKSQLIAGEPYQPGNVPVVFVHGTFSSPIWWAEMINTLNADPVLRQRCQIWSFLYSSSKPLPISATELRDALAAKVKELDPEGKDPALRQMVVIGHSQGGLLTKLTATDTGDQLFRVFSEKPLDELNLEPQAEADVRRLLFFDALPFVTRVVFISTPHRGSYLAGGLARKLTRLLVQMPSNIVKRSRQLVQELEGANLAGKLQTKMPTSLDSMSPKNPMLLKLADIPVAPTVKAHSIIPVQGHGDYRRGKDGVVAYSSAHVDYAESEYIVRGHHSCQSMPPTIEEVRRILHEHLKGLPGATAKPAR